MLCYVMKYHQMTLQANNYKWLVVTEPSAKENKNVIIIIIIIVLSIHCIECNMIDMLSSFSLYIVEKAVKKVWRKYSEE